jgi:hypothetical protein
LESAQTLPSFSFCTRCFSRNSQLHGLKQLYSLHAVKSPFDGQWFFSYPTFQRLRQSTASTAPILARSIVAQGLLQAQGGSPERVQYQLVSDNFFDALGVSPTGGRFFEASDTNASRGDWPAVLRYGHCSRHWRRSLGRRKESEY